MIKILNKKGIIQIVFVLLLLLGAYWYIPFKIEYLGYNTKVWAHQVNTLDKLRYAQKFYNGIEVDVVYDSENNTFDVNHPPSKSIDLSLDTYFSSINDRYLNIWIDFKNLSETNSNQALEILEKIVTKYSINKQRVIIESTNAESLIKFKSSGFQTSFYLPQLANLNDDKVLIARVDSIANLLEKYPTTAISCHMNAYEVVNKYFKSNTKYLWHIYKPYGRNMVNDYKDFRKMASDSAVAAILVDVTLPIGKR